MQEHIWMSDCLEPVVILAAKFAQIPDGFETVSIDLLNLFIKFIFHTQPSVCVASVFATAALLNRMPGLRSGDVFTIEGGGQILFQQLTWIGCQDIHRINEGVSKLFAILLKEPYVKVIGCHRISTMIIEVLGSTLSRIYVLELLCVAVFNPQFLHEELCCDPHNDVIETLLYHYETFALKEKVMAAYAFAGLLAQLPYEAIKWYLIWEENEVSYLSEALEDLLELEGDDQIKGTSPVCAIFDGLYRVLDCAVQKQDGTLMEVGFVTETLPRILTAMEEPKGDDNRITRVVRCLQNTLRELYAMSGWQWD
jgi:hypothetical protein